MRLTSFLLATAVISALPSSALSQTPDQTWPRWRGARFDGIANTGRAVFDGPFELRVRWKKTLGPGYSGIAIAEGHAVTMFSDGKTDVLVALASDTGAEHWRVPLSATFPPKDGSTGGPVSTPAIHDGVAYGLGPRGELVAVALATGRVIWQKHLVADLGAVEPHWGFTTSPLVAGDLLIVLTGGSPDRAVTAFDRRTGEVRWRAGSDAASYQSPMLVTIDGKDAVLAGGDKWLMVLDVRDGREIWKKEHAGTGFFAMIVNPVAVGAGQWLVTHQPGQSVLLNATPGAAPVWTTRELRGNYSQPVVHRGVIFGMAGTFLSAIDAATGERLWRSRPPGDGFPILVDGHLVILTKAGSVVVADASRDGYRERASLDLFERLVWTPPSFAEGRIFARDSYDGIAAVDVAPARSATMPMAAADVAAPDAPDADAVRRFAAQPVSPAIDGDRVHFTFSGAVDGLELLVDGRDADKPMPLTRLAGTDIVHAAVPFERDARIAYQFVRNGTEVVDDPRNPREVQSLNRAGTSRVLLMPDAETPASPPAGGLRGSVVDLEIDTPIARSAHLRWGGKRAVRVYLPPGYAADTTARYPVAYVMYGDEMRGAGLDALVDREIGSTIAPMILVFVQSTSAYEYARTFRDEHRQMLAGILVPLIDRQFRTRAAARDRVLVGIDEAGFGVVETALQHPDVFGGAVAQSLFAMTGAGDDLVSLIQRTAPAGQRFVVEWGKYDYRRASDLTDVPGYSKRVHDALAARGYTVGGREWNDGMGLTFAVDRMVRALRGLVPAAGGR